MPGPLPRPRVLHLDPNATKNTVISKLKRLLPLASLRGMPPPPSPGAAAAPRCCFPGADLRDGGGSGPTSLKTLPIFVNQRYFQVRLAGPAAGSGAAHGHGWSQQGGGTPTRAAVGVWPPPRISGAGPGEGGLRVPANAGLGGPSGPAAARCAPGEGGGRHRGPCRRPFAPLSLGGRRAARGFSLRREGVAGGELRSL